MFLFQQMQILFNFTNVITVKVSVAQLGLVLAKLTVVVAFVIQLYNAALNIDTFWSSVFLQNIACHLPWSSILDHPLGHSILF